MGMPLVGLNAGHRGCALFETAIGPCCIAWNTQAIVAVQLPEASAAATRARLIRSTGPLDDAEPPPFVQAAIEGVQSVMLGGSRDLREVPLDMAGVPDFHQRVYAIARRIVPGSTRTYGDVAKELGDIGLARAVGQALGRNPFAPIVPCHRVLAANGRPGGFSGGGGVLTKLRMLAIEGTWPGGTPSLFE
ncbi:methylated-DNA--[protein]-cysteine S-methyltransferase [Variovorax humicola]|uniref:Methylated-DNA--[protein]-cysteine S-methyltransferase n=1 Tax=Variovorax humicola TaxID=1769758 RepID=A0ABU8VUD1_9BURK